MSLVDADTGELIAYCTPDEARHLTDAIKSSAERLWSLLMEAHDRKAWAALGYTTWRDYAMTEFGMSQSHAYRLLDQVGAADDLFDRDVVLGVEQVGRAFAQDGGDVHSASRSSMRKASSHSWSDGRHREGRVRHFDANGAAIVCTSTREERLAADDLEPVHFVQHENSGWVAE